MVDEITFAQLEDMLALTEEEGVDGGRVWVAPDQPVPDDRVFGGVLLAQAVVVAGQGLPDGLVPVTLQADFLAGVPVSGENRWRGETLSESVNLVSRRVALIGEGGFELFTATVRLAVERSDLPSYASLRPRPAAGPEGLPDLSVRYQDEHRIPAWWRIRRPVDLRHVESPDFLESAAVRSTEQSLWWRVRGKVVGDALRTAAVIAYVSDMSMVEPAFRNTGTTRHGAGSRILSLTHSLIYHQLPDLTDWMQMDVAVRTIAHGRALGEGELFLGDEHVATLGQLALVKFV